MKPENLLNFDKNHVWHPYTSITEPLPVYEVVSAQASSLKLRSGETLVDGMSSWWAAIHGYNNKQLNKAVKKQLKKMSHVMFGGITHKPAVKLAKKLIEITPPNLTKVFFSDSGSVAVEVAMKMALQYRHAKGQYSKNKFITVKSGYHGDTWNAMSVCDPITGMHGIFKGSLTENFFAEQPKSVFNQEFNIEDLKSVNEIIEKHHSQITAFIIEPIVQGAGGMWFYSPQYLNEIYEICKKYDILLIFDEIATGFGRTGKMFATEYTNIQPDIMCLGKAITGGYMSFAATLASVNVAEIISGSAPGVFMHGPTFMANPLACAVALKSIKLLQNSDWKNNVKRIEDFFNAELKICSRNDNVQDVRVLGAIGVVQTKRNINIAKIQKLFVEQGVWIRPFGKLIYLMPPYIITNQELKKLTDSITYVLKKDIYE